MKADKLETLIKELDKQFKWWAIKRCVRKGTPGYEVSISIQSPNPGEKPHFVNVFDAELPAAIVNVQQEAAAVVVI